MNIIICGAGRVGFTIAKLLSEQGHSITVIDQSSEDIQKINESLDVKAIVGKGTYPSILEKANAADADMIIAVTRNDEINMLICQIAYSIFNIQKKIARIRSQDYLNPKFTRVYNKEKVSNIIKESLKNDNFNDKFKENSLSVPLKEARENFGKEYLTIQLKKINGNISKTANFVGMERSALHRKLKGLGIKEFN